MQGSAIVVRIARRARRGPRAGNGALANHMWGTIVDRDGIVCAVAFTGADRGRQWPGSRVISAQKANTGNEFSLPAGPRVPFRPASRCRPQTFTRRSSPAAVSIGLQHSNPVSTDIAYSGNPSNYGQGNDGMVGGRIGGVNVFGGGLPLYNSSGQLLGGLGVSGDTSCADHNVAYRTRNTLDLDYVPAGVSGDREPSRHTSCTTSSRNPARCPASARAVGATRSVSPPTSRRQPPFRITSRSARRAIQAAGSAPPGRSRRLLHSPKPNRPPASPVLLVSRSRGSGHKSRSAAPGWQGATTENTGSI